MPPPPGRVVEMQGEQPSVREIMKEEASAREGFVALTSPEAGGKRRGATGHVYWGLQGTFTLQCGSASPQQKECRAVKCRGSQC